MSTQPSPYGPPPHPYGQSASRQLGPVATVLIALATSGVLALALRLGG